MSQSTTFNATLACSHPISDLDIEDITVEGSLLPSGATQAMAVRVHSVNRGRVKGIRGSNLPQEALLIRLVAVGQH